MNRSTGSLESQNTQIQLHNHTTLHRIALKVKMLRLTQLLLKSGEIRTWPLSESPSFAQLQSEKDTTQFYPVCINLMNLQIKEIQYAYPTPINFEHLLQLKKKKERSYAEVHLIHEGRSILVTHTGATSPDCTALYCITTSWSYQKDQCCLQCQSVSGPSDLAILIQNERKKQLTALSDTDIMKSSHSLSSSRAGTSNCTVWNPRLLYSLDICIACSEKKQICYIPQNSNTNVK